VSEFADSVLNKLNKMLHEF